MLVTTWGGRGGKTRCQIEASLHQSLPLSFPLPAALCFQIPCAYNTEYVPAFLPARSLLCLWPLLKGHLVGRPSRPPLLKIANGHPSLSLYADLIFFIAVTANGQTVCTGCLLPPFQGEPRTSITSRLMHYVYMHTHTYARVYTQKSRESDTVPCEMPGLFGSTHCPIPRIRVKRLIMFERYFGGEIIPLFTPAVVTSVLGRTQKSLRALVPWVYF